jgi:hypothetical protein
MTLARLKPAVPKHWLMAIAGLVWVMAGGMLCYMAWDWLQPLPGLHQTALAAAGLGLALVLHRLMLAGIVRRNMRRIGRFGDRGCVFAFQAWRSYLAILVMIALGSLLRHTPLPREVLAVLYAAMGGALVLSGMVYFAGLRQVRAGGRPGPGE